MSQIIQGPVEPCGFHCKNNGKLQKNYGKEMTQPNLYLLKSILDSMWRIDCLFFVCLMAVFETDMSSLK